MAGDPIHIKPSHRDALHRELHVPTGKKISVATLEKASHSKNSVEKSRAVFALNARNFKHK